MEEKKKKAQKASEDTKNAKVFVSQRIVLYNPENQKFLVGKESSFNGDVGAWQFPGGRLDIDEQPADGLMREIVEEIGDDVRFELKGYIDHTVLSHYTKADTDGVATFHLAYYLGGEAQKSYEHEEFKWVSAGDVTKGDDYFGWMEIVINKAQEKIAQLEAHEKMLRTLAEFDNYKKRSADQQKDFAQYASENVIRDMLPVLDNFHAATEHVPEDQKESPWLTGIMFIQQQMDKVFADQGVVEIPVKVGDAFDPEIMEAAGSKGESDMDGDKVVKIAQKGYKIKEKILRPARVVVA